MSTIIHLGKSGMADKSINDDDLDRISLCLNVLSESSDLLVEVFNKLCRDSLDRMLAVKSAEEKQKVSSGTSGPTSGNFTRTVVLPCLCVIPNQAVEKKVIKVQADDPIKFGQLAPKNELGQTEDMFELTLSQALGGGADKKDLSNLAGSKLNKVSNMDRHTVTRSVLPSRDLSHHHAICHTVTRSVTPYTVLTGHSANRILGPGVR